MTVLVSGKISGTAAAVPSKSISHRALIAGALSRGESRVDNLSSCDDVNATADCLRALGAKIDISGKSALIRGIEQGRASALLNCRESASTYRMLYPVAPLIAGETRFACGPSLARRPMEPMLELMRGKGVRAERLLVSGDYSCGDFPISGGVSSQFISGLLFALSLLEGRSRIMLTTPLESKSYVELTQSVIAAFGGKSGFSGDSIWVEPGDLKSTRYAVEGDYSYAALLLCAGAAYGEVTVSGLLPDSAQGDKEIISILRGMGAEVTVEKDSVTAREASLRGMDIDARHIPDLIPAVAIAACAARGDTRIFNAGRLRLKESDRLSAIARELSRLGADIEQKPDRLIIHGGKRLRPASCNSCGDHRIAMMLALMSGLCGGVELTGGECVSKSAPGFFKQLAAMGGNVK